LLIVAFGVFIIFKARWERRRILDERVQTHAA
jgi:hypothetical protein